MRRWDATDAWFLVLIGLLLLGLGVSGLWAVAELWGVV